MHGAGVRSLQRASGQNSRCELEEGVNVSDAGWRRLSRPASDYGVDAATYLAIVTGDLAGVRLD